MSALPRDKRMHVIMGAVGGLVAVLVAVAGAEWGLWAASLVAGGWLAVGYELVQLWRGEGEPSWTDAAATTAGAAAIAFVVWVAMG